MKRQNLIVILSILVVAVVAYLATLLVGGDDLGSISGTEGEFRVELDGEPRVIRIVDAAEGDTVRLERTASGWRANGGLADTSKVHSLLPVLDTVTADALIARNPDNHARLGVSADSARTVELRTVSGSTFRFLLGDRELATGGYYVRRPDEDEVYRVDGPLGGQLSRMPNAWREYSIAQLDTASVRSVRIRRGDEQLVLSRRDGGWETADAPADSAVVEEVLRSLARLEATGFPSDSALEIADFEAPEVTLEVFGAAGDERAEEPLLRLDLIAPVLEAGEAPAEEVGEAPAEEADDTPAAEPDEWIVRRGDGELYLLPSSRVEQLAPDGTTLREGRPEEGEEG